MGATAVMDKKIISVSEKRQITLPIKFYHSLNIEKELACYIDGGKIVLEPVRREDSYFAKEILTDLVNEGFTGQALLEEFDKRQDQIRNSVRNLVEETEKLNEKGDLSSFEDIFGEKL